MLICLSYLEILTQKYKAESDSIEGPITYLEAASVLRAMSNNQSPGSDGFSAEFFKMF